jgi:protein transport protein SEC61 subunit alpha
MTLTHRKVKGYRVPYPIKLIYTSSIPILFLVAFFANFYLFSQVLDRMYGKSGNYLVRIIGKWAENDNAPVGGIVYYFFQPRNLWEIVTDPIRAIFYWAFVLALSTFTSSFWPAHSGQGGRDIMKQLIEQELIIEGWRAESMVTKLTKLITRAATAGGFVLGALCIFADFMGALGSGTGIIIAVTVIYSYFEMVSKEKQRGGDTVFM